MMPDSVVHASGLIKRYGDNTAVNGVDLDIVRGETFGLLGPNGAGKTTTMHMISCISRPSGGTLRVLGMDPLSDEVRIRSRMGICGQADRLDQELTVRENLITYARYFGMSRALSRQRADEHAEFVQLADRAGDRVDTLSGGMKRRLSIARAMINNPDLVILDEPTTGLDPQARHLLWERLYRLKQRGVTLLLSTHYMDEAEQLCDRIAVMDLGKVVAVGSPRDLIAAHAGPHVVELRFGDDPVEQYRDKVDGIGDRIDVLPERLLIYAVDADAAAAEVHRRGLAPSGVLVRRSTLEDVFFRLTGRMLVE
ncbi:ABC transporter ATP-binding protein [Micromonospora sp. CPCC 205539]